MGRRTWGRGGRGDAGTLGTRGRGDAGTWGLRDVGTPGRRDSGTWGLGDVVREDFGTRRSTGIRGRDKQITPDFCAELVNYLF